MKASEMRPSEGYVILKVLMSDVSWNCETLVEAEIVGVAVKATEDVLKGSVVWIPKNHDGHTWWEESPEGQEFQYTLVKEDVVRAISKGDNQ
jgi:hypothetical protein